MLGSLGVQFFVGVQFFLGLQWLVDVSVAHVVPHTADHNAEV